MNFYQIDIHRPELTPMVLIVQAIKAPTIDVVAKRMALDVAAEIRIRPITVLTWDLA